ncbi:MAG TPA: hypothetical protein DEO82_01935 [Eubacterium sp.]|nr:hypothetical protein [Eubacterium sp.]
MDEKKRYGRMFWVIVIGIAINMLGSVLSGFVPVNLYLDVIGTVLSSVLCGYVPGIVVGLATNILKSTYDSEAIYYTISNVTIAVISYWVYNKGFLKKKRGFLLLAVLLTVIGGGVGYFFSWLINYSSWTVASFFSYVASSIVWDFVDKLITVFILALAMSLFTERLLNWLRIEGWRQTPLTREEIFAAKKRRNRTMSLRTKILVLLLGATFAIGIAAMIISTLLYKQYAMNEHFSKADAVSKVAASFIDPNKVELYMEEGDALPEYREIEKILYDIRNANSEVEYLYVYKIMEDGCHVVFDLDTEDEEGGEPGEVIEFDKSFENLIDDLLAGKEIDPIVTDDTFGYLITVYKPLYDDNGVCQCYVAADISMEHVRSIIIRFVAKLASIFLGFIMLIVAIGLWVSEYNIIFPINTMSMSANAFVYDDEKALEHNVDRIKHLDIHTGDEIESMYQAFSKTTEDNVRYANDLNTKNETIAKMQNALIMVLADIVESRDESTGEHVKKTAAYTRIIMNKLREKGYYKEQLTEQFMYDVENSAPLHDIGKIKIPDRILNKNGKLDDDEYEIMKTHTIAGRDIIEQAMQTVPGSQYLHEAKNLAEYHHEKWNGKGYPHGLAGEDIPLSARIMAVADVFDALVSERCYKKAFSFEVAMEIIQKDAGTHFDPKVAECFIEAADEVRAVAEYYSKI